MAWRITRETICSLLTLQLLAVPLMIAQSMQPAGPGQVRPGTDIRGKITITGARESHNEHLRDALFGRYLTRGETGATPRMNPAVSAPTTLPEKTVVYLESDELNQKRYLVPGKNPLLDQRDLQFHPQVLPILVGTSVDFPNRDNLFHNVFSYSQTKEFDLGRYPKDDSRSVTFDRPGLVRVYCDIHSHMNATILVLQHPYFATPDDDGQYIIQHVPEGKYTVVLWYERDVVERRPVEIKAGETAVVNFTF